jgi:hypothetical protein
MSRCRTAYDTLAMGSNEVWRAAAALARAARLAWPMLTFDEIAEPALPRGEI